MFDKSGDFLHEHTFNEQIFMQKAAKFSTFSKK